MENEKEPKKIEKKVWYWHLYQERNFAHVA